MNEVPIKLFRTPDRLSIAAPMPGLLATDITVEVTSENRLVLHGLLRGVPADLQVFHRLEAELLVEEQREMLLDEWTPGSYHRELTLPNPVDGRLTTATYGNGVLVVALPIAPFTVAERMTLEPIGMSRGERIGSIGHPIQPYSTAEHRQIAHAL